LSKDGDTWESFKGKGQTLEGRKTKGRGISHRKVEEVATDSRIIRTDKHRVVTNSSLENDNQAPVPLNLPFGKLFFGYRYVEYVSPDSDENKGKSKAQDGADSKDWGGGQKLGRGAWKPSGVTGIGGASIPAPPNRSAKSGTDEVEREQTRSPSPDWGVDDDEMIDYDSD